MLDVDEYRVEKRLFHEHTQYLEMIIIAKPYGVPSYITSGLLGVAYWILDLASRLFNSLWILDLGSWILSQDPISWILDMASL